MDSPDCLLLLLLLLMLPLSPLDLSLLLADLLLSLRLLIDLPWSR